MIFLIVAMVIMVLARSYFIFKDRRNNIFSDGDAVIHLRYVKEYFRTGGSRIDMSDRYVLDYSDYPTGFHKLFYYLKIPIKTLETKGGFFTLIPDLIYIIILADAIGRFGSGDYYLLLFVPFLRCFFGSDARASHFNERSFGVLFGSVFLYSQSGFYLTGELFWLGIGLVSFTIASISSKFAIQAMTLFSIGLSLLCFDFSIFIFYLVSFIFSLIVSNGYSKKVIVGLLRHSMFYSEHFSSRHYGLRNNYKELMQGLLNRNFKEVLINNSVLKFVSDVPLTIPFFYIIIYESVWSFWTLYWLCACIFVVAISTEKLKFIGEPERYLEFALPAIFVTISKNVSILPESLLLLSFLISIYIFSIHYVGYYRRLKSDNGRESEVESLVRFVNEKRPKVILTIPLRLSFLLGYHCSEEIKYISNFVNIGVGGNKDLYKELIPDIYPYVNRNFVPLCKKYNVDYVVIDKRAVSYLHSFKPDYYYRFNRHLITHETATIMVINPYVDTVK